MSNQKTYLVEVTGDQRWNVYVDANDSNEAMEKARAECAELQPAMTNDNVTLGFRRIRDADVKEIICANGKPLRRFSATFVETEMRHAEILAVDEDEARFKADQLMNEVCGPYDNFEVIQNVRDDIEIEEVVS
ncbi:MAG: hypothetical protein ABL901_10140 [Hyphomicrobiaceae bacterium]